MEISVFDFEDYKKYFKKKLELKTQFSRGFKAQMAREIGCQPSYLSQIISGKPDLTLDQGLIVNKLFDHDKIEGRYFLLLIQLARAQTRDLKNFTHDQMTEILVERFNLKQRLKNVEKISSEDMQQYYSTWHYAAIHMALAIPELNTTEKIAKRFNLTEEFTSKIITFLIKSGLVIKTANGYEHTKTRIFLEKGSDLIQRHHLNWRSKSLQSVEVNAIDDFHYSTLFAISKKDHDKIREILIKSIESSQQIIRPSPSEEVYSLLIDFFKI